MRLSRQLMLIYAAAFVRAWGIGLLGVVLGVYLFRVGLSATRIGIVLATGLAGMTLSTAFVSLRGDGIGRRRLLVSLAVVGCLGGVGLAVLPSFGPLLVVAFVGMLNGMGTDRSATFALEQAIIPGLVVDRSRTWALSWYNALLDAGAALGALAGGLPLALQSWRSIDLASAYKHVFLGYAVVQLVTAGLYAQLSPDIEVRGPFFPSERATISTTTKSVVRRLAALFSLDSFGGGFLGDALVS